MANANRGLGKGLGALLGDAALRTDTSKTLCRISPIPSASTASFSR